MNKVEDYQKFILRIERGLRKGRLWAGLTRKWTRRKYMHITNINIYTILYFNNLTYTLRARLIQIFVVYAKDDLNV